MVDGWRCRAAHDVAEIDSEVRAALVEIGGSGR
jgi:hypothetical protein